MAAVEQYQTFDAQEPKLQYLGCFWVAGEKASGYVATIYELAKENSGPLKPGVDKIEGTVKAVVGPVYDKFEGKPLELLEFLDEKVGGTLVLLDEHVPSSVKEKSHQAFDVVNSIVSEVRTNGVFQSVNTYYIKYEPVAEKWTVDTLKKIKNLPGVPQFIELVGPSALYGVGVFNNVIGTLKDKQVPFSSYLPSIPLEKLEKVFQTGAD